MSDPPFPPNEPFMGSFLSQPSLTPLKRPRAASAPCENDHIRQRKRSRGNPATGLLREKIIEDNEEDVRYVQGCTKKSKGKAKELPPPESHSSVFGRTGNPVVVIEELAQELKCGCCTELCYNPVVVNPCQHYFCGSCCILWVRNGGTNCPACRSVSTNVTPSRILQSMIDLLLRSDPARARTEAERAQADQVYRAGTSLRLPTPRPATPEPNLEPPNDNYARPCPTCLPGNAYGWRCPVPIPDPAVDQEHALDLDDGMPVGHNFCGNCDQLHNIHAPTSSRCDMCQVSFCGVGIQGRCCAISLALQQPQGMTELQDLILSGSVYDSFQKNSVEVDILVDYLRVNEISLRGVYKEIVNYIIQKPNGFAALIDMGIFDDLHPVSGGDDPDPSAPRQKICRPCAAQVLLHGLKDWWIRERRHGNLPPEVVARKDCPQGSLCDRQPDQVHAKEFNHIIQPPQTNGRDAPSEPPLPPLISELTKSIPENREQGRAADVDMFRPALTLSRVDPSSSTSISHPLAQDMVAESSARDGGSSGASGYVSAPGGALEADSHAPLDVPNVNGGDIVMADGENLEHWGQPPRVDASVDVLEPGVGAKTPSGSRAHVPAQ